MKLKTRGFTIVELLTALAVIMVLVSILIPSVTAVRNMAKETKQKAQFATIDMALMAFRGDYGIYPPSNYIPVAPNNDYCGAQKFAEALLGWDLLGFHPNSQWTATGQDFLTRTVQIYQNTDQNIDERVGPYLDLATTDVYKLGDLFAATATLAPTTHVICDGFGVKKPVLAPGRVVKAGTPILYFRANTTSKTMLRTGIPDQQIYSIMDNIALIGLGRMTDGQAHPLGDPALFYSSQPGGLIDPRVTSRNWPYRPDSYILISAGLDGLYGTRDDITNF